jgi:hypothetical protein
MVIEDEDEGLKEEEEELRRLLLAAIAEEDARMSDEQPATAETAPAEEAQAEFC